MGKGALGRAGWCILTMPTVFPRRRTCVAKRSVGRRGDHATQLGCQTILQHPNLPRYMYVQHPLYPIPHLFHPHQEP